MPTAITRQVNRDMGACELSYLPRVEIDVALAEAQHRQYTSALSSLGCEVCEIETGPGMPDSVFIEDTALVLDEIAVLCRPGAESRRREVRGVRKALEQHRKLAVIEAPGTLDGGDLLCIGNSIFAGLSGRSSLAGVVHLENIVADYGYTVYPLEMDGCLHLKSAVSVVAPDTLLINPEWVDPSVFGLYELIEIDSREAHAANALLINDTLIYPSSFPRTMEILSGHGLDLLPVELTELQKAEGAVTCCSLILNTA